MAAGKQVARSSCCGTNQTSSSLTQRQITGLGRGLVLRLLLSPENKSHICLQLDSCSVASVCPCATGFAYQKQYGKMQVLFIASSDALSSPNTRFLSSLGRTGTSPSGFEPQPWKPAELVS